MGIKWYMLRIMLGKFCRTPARAIMSYSAFPQLGAPPRWFKSFFLLLVRLAGIFTGLVNLF